ncbi:MAG: hypothetical protein A2504_05985 [Bdellovibrionales bacterium RIFOXYD12_FULL_39_22]|nr:MAG: hypothetical protein A2385_08305 [Bdellovibrionales bacterium RIFOXYB1_FULL_39_21]OFZ45295.1 MAG: hypothetical protein A2485_06235 [Bdellovibrionales bacterium RIFOXYC12_FULL_39_17]OFZ45516.1 MAG: hypothetical protein A2404_02885 [Bdellovibrionales bacterium RIFOXYC1_FULL_39_130]OFZ77377.1 MAG: hypothetical protein A2560_08475 [Bdellovibrionales bacterium RIFOXYD1_FULL_39_84]OFZ91506.1 MAG: hypothetical protein A2504_05985 [Bdellovibrionales bacterium RIFOXYD12_FULL_39_22]HLE12038.1 nu
MRLVSSEIDIIVKILSKFSNERDIYLHGSRIDDGARGGDIDLFFVVEDNIYSTIKSSKYKIESELSLELNEQRIDLAIINKAEKSTNSFFLNSKKLKVSPQSTSKPF